MRGKILQYNGNDGTGIVVANDQQHKFTISVWKGASAPAVGKTVEIVLGDGGVQSVTLVGDDVLLREKTAELTGKLGGLVSELGKGGAGGVAGTLVARFGKQVLVAYGLFLISTLFLPAINMPMLGNEPMFKLASILATLGGGGGIKLLLILSYLSLAVPLFWPDRRGWLALLLPLLTVLWAFITAKGTFGGRGGGSLGDLVGMLGVGYYLALISAVVLAHGGWKRFRAAA